MRRAATEAFHLLSRHRRGCSTTPLLTFSTSPISDPLSSTLYNSFVLDAMISLSHWGLSACCHHDASRAEEDQNFCSEFSRWHNGGGYFHRSAVIDRNAQIETGAVVHSNSIVGPNVYIGSGAVIGPSVSIGESTKIGYNAVLSNCSVGVSCIMHSGVCIGQDGFGFFVDEDGCVKKKPQMLHVRIGNYVEVGANTCIDRGSWRDTVIGDHSKIDNLVQIGHNVIIGKGCMICGQVGIAGSAIIGDYVTMAGRAAVGDHISIASKVRLAANTGVTKNILTPGDYAGFPAIPIKEWRKQVLSLRRLDEKKDPFEP